MATEAEKSSESTHGIDPDRIREALVDLVSSRRFASAPRISRFLQFVVGEELAGRGARLNGTVVAIEVFDRDKTFDHRADPVVRVEARQLRSALEHYYLTEGRDATVRIDVPKGGYRPRFTLSARSNSQDATSHSPKSVESRLASWTPPRGPVIAVLPFHTMGDEADQVLFAQGLTSTLIAALTRFDLMQVIAQQSTVRYRQNDKSIRHVGFELGARFVLQGSIHRQNERIRVTASLSDTSNGTQLWAETYDRDLSTTGLFDLEDDLTGSVVAIVGDIYGVVPRALAAGYRDKPAQDLTTYEAILRFASYLNRNQADDYHPAREALEQAVIREPEQGQAWAGLSMLCSEDYLRGLTEHRGPPQRAWRLANRAASLTPNSATVHLARAMAAFTMRRPAIVVREASRAIEINPNAVDSVGFSAYMIGFAGDLQRGIAILESVHQLNPFYPSWLLGLSCLAHYMDEEYEQALAVAERFTLDESPGKPLYLAAVLGQMGRLEEARSQIDRLRIIEPDFFRDPADYVYRNYLVDRQIEKILDGLQLSGVV